MICIYLFIFENISCIHQNQQFVVGVDRLSAPILSILPIIDIGHFQNIFADTNLLL